MTRQIELYKVNKWNRATIANGDMLQANTVGPFTNNDSILAASISSYGQELSDYYDSDEYRTVTSTLTGDMDNWNRMSSTISSSSGYWEGFCDSYWNNSGRYSKTTDIVSANSALWDTVPVSAASGCSAYKWIEENGLPGLDDFVSKFQVLRVGSSVDNQYEYYGGDVGKDTLTIAMSAAWKEDSDGNKVYNMAGNRAPGTCNLSIFPHNVNDLNGDCNQIQIHDNDNIYANDSLLFGRRGIFQHDTEQEVLPVVRDSDYAHIDTDSTMAFASFGADDMVCSLVNSPVASVNLKNTFARGGTCQNIENSIGISYQYLSCGETVDTLTQNECSELYGVYDSIANLKGRARGIHASIAIKGSISSIKGKDEIPSILSYHSKYELGVSNSYATQDCSFNCFPYSDISNSLVSQYNIVCGLSASSGTYKPVTDSIVSTRNGSFEEGRWSPVRSIVDLDSFASNLPAASVTDSFYSERETKMLSPTIANSMVEFSRIDGTYGTYSNVLLRAMDTSLVSPSFSNTIFRSLESANMIYATVSDCCMLECRKVNLVSNNIQRDLVLRADESNFCGTRNVSYCYNNLLNLNLTSGCNGYFDNSMVYCSYTRPIDVTTYDGIIRRNMICRDVGVRANESVPGGNAENTEGGLMLATNVTGPRNYSPFGIHSMILRDSNIHAFTNIVYLGSNITNNDTAENSTAQQVLIGSNLTLGGSKNAHSEYVVFGNDLDVQTSRTSMKSIIVGSNFSNTNTKFVALVSKLNSSSTIEPTDMFILCDSTGPFFVVTSVGYSTDKKHNGVYFYKDSKWYDVITNTELV